MGEQKVKERVDGKMLERPPKVVHALRAWEEAPWRGADGIKRPHIGQRCGPPALFWAFMRIMSPNPGVPA